MSENVLSLRKRWQTLRPLAPEQMVGADWEASFVAPLRHIAPPGLGLIGLPRWYGKRFTRTDGGPIEGVNLVRSKRTAGTLYETLPMTLGLDVSIADDEPCLAVTYASDAPVPWRWVRDELRRIDDDTLLGMTYVDLPGARLLGGTPFLLNRR